MTFNSFHFYLFFPFVVVVHYLLPKRWRWMWLLIASYVFYGLSDIRFVLVLVACTLISYLAGRMIARQEDRTKRKRWQMVGTGLIVLILIVFKYMNFALGSVSMVLAAAGLQWQWRGVELLFPVGISFYTLQVISYLLDVGSGKVRAEKNLLQYTLFVSFFPQLLIGPIERFGQLRLQLTNPQPFSWERLQDGLARIGWGLFKKFVIADRLAMVANTVFAAPETFPSSKLMIAVVAFAFQVYLDFAAYTDIAIGAAGILGITLTENFDRPYFARSVVDFWRRWHISLSNWLRDYVFLKLNYKHRRKKPRQLWTGLDVMATFLISGLWHGSNWTFVVWGLLHGIYQTLELLTQKGRDKLTVRLEINRERWMIKTWQRLITFLLVGFAWIFFKAASLNQATNIVRAIFTLDGISKTGAWTLLDGSMGLDKLDMLMMVGTLVVYMVIEWLQGTHDLLAIFKRQPIWVRWIAYYALLGSIIVFGFYGEASVVDFVYFQF